MSSCGAQNRHTCITAGSSHTCTETRWGAGGGVGGETMPSQTECKNVSTKGHIHIGLLLKFKREGFPPSAKQQLSGHSISQFWV